MHNDRPVSRLLLLPLHGSYEVDHSSSLGRDPDFRPAVEVEESDVLGLLFLLHKRWEVSKLGRTLMHHFIIQQKKTKNYNLFIVFFNCNNQ